ncbi:hypothetical protein GWI33_010433, partial [Rhynchophorus ferrugineus]
MSLQTYAIGIPVKLTVSKRDMSTPSAWIQDSNFIWTSSCKFKCCLQDILFPMGHSD